MDESEAVEAFERLGLTGYEAKVFIALHRIGSGTAREVSEATDVPRSQVYSAAESLADRGLVDVQQSSPIQYRPASLEAARSTLRDRFQRERDRAFDYVETVRREGPDEQREDIWTMRGREGIGDRAAELIDEADDRAVFGTAYPGLVTPAIESALRDRARAGVETVVVSETASIRERFADDPVEATAPPPAFADNERAGRFVFVDRDVLLMSVVGNGEGEDRVETAVWSAHTSFADLLIRIVEVSLGIE